MPQPSQPRRVRAPEAKRAALLESAFQLFSVHGYEATSVADIARQAGTAVGTVYKHYPDKAALLRALHGTLEERFVAAMAQAWDTTLAPGARFDPLCEAVFDLIAETRERIAILSMTTGVVFDDGSLPGDRVRAAIEAMLADAIENGDYRDGDPALLAACMHGMVEGAMRTFLRDPTPERRAQIIATLPDLMRGALLPEGRPPPT